MSEPLPASSPTALPMPTRHEAYLRHARCYIALAEEADAHITSPEQARWLQELDSDYESLLAAMRWLKMQNDGALGSRLALALCQFWDIRGYWAEARQWLETMAEQAAVDGQFDEALLARVLNEAGIFCRMQSDLDTASAFFQRALAIHQKRSDLKGQGTALNGLGAIALMRGETAIAREFLEAALAVQRQRNDPAYIARGLHNLAVAYFNERDYAAAEKLQVENQALQRRLGNLRELADALTNLGNTRFRRGHYPEAKECHQESLALKIQLNYLPGLSDSYLNLAVLALKMGEYRIAREHLREALKLYKQMEDIEGFACVFEALAELAACRQRSETVVFWSAAAAALRRKHHISLLPADAQEVKSSLAKVRSALGKPAFQAAWRRGRTLSLNRAITRALEEGH